MIRLAHTNIIIKVFCVEVKIFRHSPNNIPNSGYTTTSEILGNFKLCRYLS